MTDQERIIFHQNFNDMLQKIGCTPYRINGPGRKGEDIAGWEQAPSYSILSRCKNDPLYIPSDETVNKIVRFYNANLTPPTDAYAFRHDRLIINGMTPKLTDARLGENLLGHYYGYYLSDHYLGETHGCYLTIFRTASSFRARMVLSLQEDQQFHDPKLLRVFQETVTLQESRQRFLDYRQQLPSASLKRCYYCEGTLRVFDRSVVMELTNVNNASHLMILTLNTLKSNHRKEYIGGLSIALSPSTDGLETRVFRIALSKRRFSLSDQQVAAFLPLTVEPTQRIQLTSSDDQLWYNMILQRESDSNELP